MNAVSAASGTVAVTTVCASFFSVAVSSRSAIVDGLSTSSTVGRSSSSTVTSADDSVPNR